MQAVQEVAYYKDRFANKLPPEQLAFFLKTLEDSFNSDQDVSNDKRLLKVIQKIKQNKIALENLEFVPQDYPSDGAGKRPIQVEVYLNHEKYKRIYFKVLYTDKGWYLFDSLIQVTQ